MSAQQSNIPPSNTPVIGDVASKEDIYDFLSEDDKETPLELPKEKSKEKEGEEPVKEEEIDELTQIEEEIEEPTEDKLELTIPVRRQEILKKYPNIFKDFPYLERAYFREQQFTELLPTIDDAKEAVEKSKALDNFEADLMQSGSLSGVLEAVKREDQNTFYRIADNYLTALHKVDEKAYYNVVGNLIKNTIIQMIRESQVSKNEALQSAAHILNQWAFGSSEFSQPQTLSKPQQRDDKTEELTMRERQFITRQFESARDGLSTKVDNILKSTIEGHIDPKSSMTDYVRRNASREALESLQSLIDSDSRFRSLLDKLWEKAFQDSFSQISLDRIKSAYLSKAKTLLPSVIKKARNEALRGLGKRVAEEEETPPEKEEGSPRPRQHVEKRKNSEVPKGMSTREFFMQD